MTQGDRLPCPNHYHSGVGRKPKKRCNNYAGMHRMYVRKVIPGKGQRFVEVGWWCHSCGKIVIDDKKDIEKRFYPGRDDQDTDERN